MQAEDPGRPRGQLYGLVCNTAALAPGVAGFVYALGACLAALGSAFDKVPPVCAANIRISVWPAWLPRDQCRRNFALSACFRLFSVSCCARPGWYAVCYCDSNCQRLNSLFDSSIKLGPMPNIKATKSATGRCSDVGILEGSWQARLVATACEAELVLSPACCLVAMAGCCWGLWGCFIDLSWRS